jgi:hypothetical protein
MAEIDSRKEVAWRMTGACDCAPGSRAKRSNPRADDDSQAAVGLFPGAEAKPEPFSDERRVTLKKRCRPKNRN